MWHAAVSGWHVRLRWTEWCSDEWCSDEWCSDECPSFECPSFADSAQGCGYQRRASVAPAGYRRLAERANGGEVDGLGGPDHTERSGTAHDLLGRGCTIDVSLEFGQIGFGLVERPPGLVEATLALDQLGLGQCNREDADHDQRAGAEVGNAPNRQSTQHGTIDQSKPGSLVRPDPWPGRGAVKPEQPKSNEPSGGPPFDAAEPSAGRTAISFLFGHLRAAGKRAQHGELGFVGGGYR